MQKTAPDIEGLLNEVRGDVEAALDSIPSDVLDLKSNPFSFFGKAARARFTLLLAAALDADRARARKAAAAAELTHTASLLHDDCLDRAPSRRGLPTLYARLGPNRAVLAGDLLVALAFDMAGRASPELQPELAHAVRRMTEGALLEENSRGSLIGAEQADRIAVMKTGALFRWCGLAACHLAGNRAMLAGCARLGEETGAAFQIIDDVLDLEGEAGACGKEPLKDIKDGKITLPLILALGDAAAGPRAKELLAASAAAPEADLAPALALADLLRSGGFAAAARASAMTRLKALSAVTAGFPDREAAAALDDFLLSLGGRLC